MESILEMHTYSAEHVHRCVHEEYSSARVGECSL